MLLNELSSRVMLASILVITACLVSSISKKVKPKQGPSGMSFDDYTNCTEFSKFARFNPLSVLRDKWFVFYYWAPFSPLTTYVFTFPSANHTRHLKRLFEGNVVLPVMWNARQILMEDNRELISLLVERSDRGEYWSYPVARVEGGHKITPRDVRLRQTGDNRLLGFMDCRDETVLVMARLNDVPRKDRLHEEASRLGYRGRRGKSYLYQGHEWGPIPEADEELFWDYRKKEEKISKSTKNKSLEESTVEVEPLTTTKPDHSKEKQNKPRESKAVSPVADLDNEMCVKVEPELWNDPKPNPKPDRLRITKKELDHLDEILDTNNSLTIEAPDESPKNKQENKLNKESAITQEFYKLDNYKEVEEDKMEVSLNEAKNLELHTDSSEDENCVVCYKSEVSYISTDEPYRPESARPITIAKNNEEVPHNEVPRPKLPNLEVQRAEVPLAKEPRSEKPQAKKSRGKVPLEPHQDLTNSSETIILSPKTLDDLKS